MTLINSCMLKTFACPQAKYQTKQIGEMHLGFLNSITSSGEIIMSFTTKNNCQWQPPNSGIKHLKSEECEHFQISSRPNTQYQTTLPLNSHKAHYTSTWMKL